MNRSKKTPAHPPKWDAFHFRLPDSRDQLRLIELFKRSGARTKTEYIRAHILDEHFRVVTVDKGREANRAHRRKSLCDSSLVATLNSAVLLKQN